VFLRVFVLEFPVRPLRCVFSGPVSPAIHVGADMSTPAHDNTPVLAPATLDDPFTDFTATTRAVVFAGHNLFFTPMQAARHRFGIRLIRALSTTLNLSEASGLHAMLLWTISVSQSARGGNLDVCVACLVACVKMHDTIFVGLSRFATACNTIFQSRAQVSWALECSLLTEKAPHEAAARDAHISYLAAVLKMLDSTDLVHEASQLSAMHLRYAEIFLLFTGLRGQWYRYLIELYEYLRSKTHDMERPQRLAVVLEVCHAQEA
jgi:hypothetical protein